MSQRTFRNFQPGDNFRTKKMEIFEIKDRTTYFCKGCKCKLLDFCDEMKNFTTLTIQSQRGIWEMTLQEMNKKYIENEIELWR
tara:strand:- start:4181 stop:4429 length:249 start_codon:yes stop_codon:yes gene_type:complete